MKKTSKSVLILDILANSPNGLTFTEIQTILWDMGHRARFTRRNRGWWCTNLLGAHFHHRGLLRTFAYKGSDGRWHRNDLPHNGKPWSLVERDHPFGKFAPLTKSV